MDSLADLRDEDLVRRIQAGDQAALQVLTERCTARFRGLIDRRLQGRLRRKIAASDVLQEASIAALRHLADFEDRGEGSFGHWFHRIVESKIASAARLHVGAGRRSIRHEISHGGRRETAQFVAPDPSPSEVAVVGELREAVERALEDLPGDYREVICHLQEERLTLDETARRMGRSKGAVKKLYSRALAQMEELLGLETTQHDGRRRPTR